MALRVLGALGALGIAGVGIPSGMISSVKIHLRSPIALALIFTVQIMLPIKSLLGIN